MRAFNFKARNIGEEKYLTYTMGEECELDEDTLDYCEENNVAELLGIIYEEDDDYDYLTYDISGITSLEDYTKNSMNQEQVLSILRNVANSLISIKEQTISLSYILLNKRFVYVDEESYELKFICLPIESEGSLSTEFKGFIRHLIAGMKYDVDEDLGYVGKLLTYINGDAFNLRGLVGLTEALMEEYGICFDQAGAIESDGVEVVNEEPDLSEAEETSVTQFMQDTTDEPLPEIGDDEEEDSAWEEESDDGELESILPAGMKVAPEKPEELVPEQTDAAEAETEQTAKTDETVKDAAETEDAATPETEAEEPAPAQQQTETAVEVKQALKQKETDVDLIKNRIRELVGEVPTAKTKTDSNGTIKTLEELDEFLDSKPPIVKKNVVKVNRAALIQSAAEHESVTEELAAPGESEDTSVPVIGEVYDNNGEEKPKSNSVLSQTVAEPARTSNILNVPKANPYIVRVNTEERIMLTKAIFKIGKATRGVDYTVRGNGAISRQHAVIIQKDGVCYIKDNKSTNHTYVNGKVVEDGIEEILTHDSMITLGDEDFLFKIR